ncbi:MAG: hypothetical protein CMK56_06225 [Proteobacteria bacterium]|nr:hypothetical protein [Pseudomonadota bacterium]
MKSIVLILAFFSLPAVANNCHTEANADHNHAHDHAQSNGGSEISANIEIDESKLKKMTAGLSNIKVAVVGVKGMVCDFCARGLEKAFKKDKLVVDLDVDLEKGQLMIVYNAEKNIDYNEISDKIIANGQEPIKMEVREI